MQNTFRYHDNYYLRKCFLERDQVPSQSLIRKKMSPALASIFFKSMTPKLKVIAGLEPPLKGGGENWFVSPKVLLEEGRVVLKPLKNKYMVKWNCYGMDEIGMKWIDVYRAQMKAERKKIAYQSDLAWSHKLELLVEQHKEDCVKPYAKANTEFIKAVFHEFHCLFSRTITHFQDIIFNAAINKIKKYREDIYEKSQKQYEHLLHEQATMLYDRYTKRLEKTILEIKQNFNTDLIKIRAKFIKELHDINLEKHIAIEKLRHYLECQTLACQIYVALKERMEYNKEIESFEDKQRKKLQTLKHAVQSTEIAIRLADAQEKRQMELDKMWKKKACLVVEALQQFVTYSLKETPEQAAFFLNLEKLMMLQMNQILEKPNVQSVITQDEEYSPPKAKLRPFYLFRNKRSDTSVDSALCPKGVTSSSSHMPVIVVNKQCIYSACDNFELFTDDIQDYLLAEGRFNEYLKDDHDYSVNLNVTYTASEQLRELKLESSMMQILQQEIANIRGISIDCHGCKIPTCFSCFGCPYSYKIFFKDRTSGVTLDTEVQHDITTPEKNDIPQLDELRLRREPKWDSYIKYLESRKCNCHKSSKNLRQCLPVYMRKMSEYEPVAMHNYETCSAAKLKNLVRNAKRGKYTSAVAQEGKENKKHKATQCSDIEYEHIFNCLCAKYFGPCEGFNSQCGYSGSTTRDLEKAPPFIEKSDRSFMAARVVSLQRLIEQAPEIEEIFTNRHCN